MDYDSLNFNLSSSKCVSHGNVSGKSENRDEHWSSGPKVHTQSIQILPALQTL